jgi:L-alanine-DL-glutamate epimerase-like enolase superfamily enzyme
MVKALRQNTDSILRVDANAGWTTEEALQKIPFVERVRSGVSRTTIGKR